VRDTDRKAKRTRYGSAQTPDDIDRNDQYLPEPVVSTTKLESALYTVVAVVGFVGLLTLLWWVGRP
jgi:hypothetical protein